MNPPIENETTDSDIPTIKLKRNRLSSFRRTQTVAATWGILILLGGWLHNTYGKDLGFNGLLLMWLGITVVGLTLSYVFAPEFLSANMFFWWPLALLLGFGGNLLLVYVFTPNGGMYNASYWHLTLAVGYAITGYFMDRRWWCLAIWEILIAILMAWLILDNSTRLPGQALQINGFIFTKNNGLLFGLTAGLPLLIAALPVWKERYAKS